VSLNGLELGRRLAEPGMLDHCERPWLASVMRTALDAGMAG
jgi:hypothetical protein